MREAKKSESVGGKPTSRNRELCGGDESTVTFFCCGSDILAQIRKKNGVIYIWHHFCCKNIWIHVPIESDMENKIEKKRLFISYAWEDAVVAEWLARKLMCCGYSIWIDRMFLRGGRTWPENIDDAIKNQSIRMIHILSKHSKDKPNPSKERQMGLTISKTIPGFLIPINLDLTPEELPFQLTDVQYIMFDDWSKGFKDLLTVLEEDRCPKELGQEGVEAAIETYLPVNAFEKHPENLYSNVFQILGYPKRLIRFGAEFQIQKDIAEAVGWPMYEIKKGVYLSFWQPPECLASKYKIRVIGQDDCSAKQIETIPTHNIVKSLLQQSFYETAKRRGFKVEDKNRLVFPPLSDNKRLFRFTDFSGEKISIGPHGYKKVRNETISYSLAFKPTVISIGESYFVIIVLHVATYYSDGKPVESQKRIAMRKAIVRSWWNRHWYARCAGIVAYLAAGSDRFSLGSKEEGEVIFSSQPVVGESPIALNDEVIAEISKIRSKKLSAAEMATFAGNDDKETIDEE